MGVVPVKMQILTDIKNIFFIQSTKTDMTFAVKNRRYFINATSSMLEVFYVGGGRLARGCLARKNANLAAPHVSLQSAMLIILNDLISHRPRV